MSIKISKQTFLNKSKFNIHVERQNSYKIFNLTMESKNHVMVPFAKGLEIVSSGQDVINQKKFPFNGELENSQKEICDQLLTCLTEYKTAIASCHMGFGKTVLALFLSSFLSGMGKVIITNGRKILLQQWMDAAKEFIPEAKIVWATSQTKPELISSAQVIIASFDTLTKHKFSNVGLFVVDELHTSMSPVTCFSLLHISPKAILGLSATPWKKDGFNEAIPWFFGKHKVSKSIVVSHNVYKVETKIVPITVYKKGKLDWSTVISSLASSMYRNILIVNIVTSDLFKEKKWLIVSKRIHQVLELDRLFRERGIVPELLIEDRITYDQDASVIIGTTGKIGIGFNNPNLNALLMAADVVDYYEQYFGRVIRRPDAKPIVVDLVDAHSILVKHWNKRKEIYKTYGGTIKNLSIE